MTTNVTLFVLAAVLEIAGCFAVWVWVRRVGAAWVVVLGIASLVGFALVLTRIDSAFAGRAYAAYLDHGRAGPWTTRSGLRCG